ncbi:MAG TPA: hypothetical protein VIX12_05830 [Candidatus Binataceae bacterium]
MSEGTADTQAPTSVAADKPASRAVAADKPAARAVAADKNVKLSAALARIRIPAGVLATLAPGNRIEAEPELGLEPIVRLMVGTTVIALASVEDTGRCLIAKVIRIGDEPAGRKLEQWHLMKNTTTPD